MATTDTVGAAVRHVRCPKCHSVLQEPAGVPVYQCGGCGASLRASPRAASSPRAPGHPADVRAADAASPQSVLPPPPSPQRSQSKSKGDVAGTSAAADASTTTGRREAAGGVAPEVTRPESPVVEEKWHDDHRSADREAGASSESPRGTGGYAVRAERGGDAGFSGGSRDAAADSETRRGTDAAARKRDSGETAPAPAPSRPRSRNLEEASMSAPAADGARPVLKSRQGDEDAAPAAAEGKVPSPPRKALSPLHEKILKTVDELKGDLSELFSQSPEAVVKPRTPPRPPRHLLPRQQQERGHVPRPAMPATRARPAAAGALRHHAEAAPPRGLPSRRYRRCRADPCGCGYDARRIAGSPCHGHGHHGCCGGSCCRDRHCCGSHSSRARPREEKPAPTEVSKRRAPPTRLQQHCRPVLKGAPFIVCSSCFVLVQVPAGFAVPASKVRELRCGACSAVLSYSYRDRDRETKKNTPPPENGHGARRPDLFAFIDDFAAPSSYSTTEDDEPQQPLHVSRNSSFEFGGVEKPKQSNSLHRLMGYGSARELLLLPRSPSLYEHGSFDDDEEGKRTPTMTPPTGVSRRHEHGGDRKGKGVCLDADTDDGDDDSDDAGLLRRSWQLHGGGRGVPPPPGAIRIRS